MKYHLETHPNCKFGCKRNANVKKTQTTFCKRKEQRFNDISLRNVCKLFRPIDIIVIIEILFESNANVRNKLQ
jgi:hypothetical protein